MLDRCPEYPLYPGTSLDLSGYRRALVLAPHPDDEIYGCGGLLRLLVEAGADVSVLVITDGGQGGSGRPAEVRAVRMAESRASARVVGFERIRFMGLEDRSRLARPSRRKAMTASGQADQLDLCATIFSDRFTTATLAEDFYFTARDSDLY